MAPRAFHVYLFEARLDKPVGQGKARGANPQTLQAIKIPGPKMNFNAQNEFQRYKDEILKMIQVEDYRNELIAWVHHKHENGYTKQQLYDILLQFLPYTDLINDTDERLYDRMADFLDGFTYSGKSWRILPGEPDAQ